MRLKVHAYTALVLFCTAPAWPQNPAEWPGSVPIYRVTVVERTVKAVNYQYRTGPTNVDFRGTILLPQGRGHATVESKQGRTEIDARFSNIEPPTRFGREYLTYVLWAITPQGHATNLGEVLADGSNKCKLQVTSDLQAFGMIVTAEPYGAVRQPSDVVVLENEIRPDTIGQIEPIQAKYELLPRGEYTYNVPADLSSSLSRGPKVSMDEYQSLVEVYEAQNAVQIARAAGADRYAGDTLSKAEQFLRNAQNLQSRKAGVSLTVTAARQAAQTAEDARLIALKRAQEERLSRAREEATTAQERQANAEAEARRAADQASAERARADAERAARERAEAEAAQAQQQLTQKQAQAEAPPEPPHTVTDSATREMRARLRQELNSVLQTRDTPRGLVITLSDAYFSGAQPRSSAYDRLARIAAIVQSQPGLKVEIEGHTDNAFGEEQARAFSLERAEAVTSILARDGVPAAAIMTRGLGKTRPINSNATAIGREQNRRVEIVITGGPIGEMPYWARSYSVIP